MIYTMQQYNQQLVDARVALSNAFKRDLSHHTASRCRSFMLRYCHTGGHLAMFCTDWTAKLAEVASAQDKSDLAEVLFSQASVMQQRHALLKRDSASLSEALGESLGDPAMTVGVKQMRSIYQDCLRRKTPEVWLAILFEYCRIRLVHGSVLVQMCRGYFNGHLLRKLRHVRYEHRQSAEQLTKMDALLHSLFLHGNLPMQELIVSVKSAISAYAAFIHDCCELVTVDAIQ